MTVVGCDPGTRESAFVIFDGFKVLEARMLRNEDAIEWLKDVSQQQDIRVFACEWIENMGMPAVGQDVFRTCYWVGRFVQAWPGVFEEVTRRQVKLNLCGSSRAKDANIRQAIIDRFGGDLVAKGRAGKPGPLYGLKEHLWSAFGVALTWWDQQGAVDGLATDK